MTHVTMAHNSALNGGGIYLADTRCFDHAAQQPHRRQRRRRLRRRAGRQQRQLDRRRQLQTALQRRSAAESCRGHAVVFPAAARKPRHQSRRPGILPGRRPARHAAPTRRQLRHRRFRSGGLDRRQLQQSPTRPRSSARTSSSTRTAAWPMRLPQPTATRRPAAASPATALMSSV